MGYDEFCIILKNKKMSEIEIINMLESFDGAIEEKIKNIKPIFDELSNERDKIRKEIELLNNKLDYICYNNSVINNAPYALVRKIKERIDS